MKLQFLKIRDMLTDSFWFMPAMMALLAGVMAVGGNAVDHYVGDDWVHTMHWIWSGGADGARSVLSVIAGSVMTVISIVFSLTITTLAQTSSQFGPRVLRNFTSDRGVQFTLGTFIATFVYCLLVLRTVRSVQESVFVPYLSVTLGVLLALISLAVLIYFIHHISQIIQAENLIADVGQDFERVVPALFPEHSDEHQKYAQATDDVDWQHGQIVHAGENGYLQRVDEDQLMELASRYDLQLSLEKRPGDFVSRGSCLLRALPPANLKDEVIDTLLSSFSQGQYRTPHQDPLYSLQQLVEIAARALSPGINEPFTALTCIDWLGSSLRMVAGRDMPVPKRYDKNGKLRLVIRSLTFEELVNSAFDLIRIYGASNPEVMTHLLHTLADMAPCLQCENDREVLMHHVRLIGVDTKQISNEADRSRVEKHLRVTLQAFGAQNAYW